MLSSPAGRGWLEKDCNGSRWWPAPSFLVFCPSVVQWLGAKWERKGRVSSLRVALSVAESDSRTDTDHKSSPPRSQSSGLLSETVAGGIASGVRSEPAAVRWPGTPGGESGCKRNKTDRIQQEMQMSKPAETFTCRYLISHVGQVFKSHRRAEHLVIHIHDLVLVAAGVQVVNRVLDDVQSLVAWCL